MGQIVTTYADLPQHLQSLTLGDTQHRLRLSWQDRTNAWYADLLTLSGTPIFLGQRVSTGWALGLGLTPENRPAGELFVRGPPEYDREDLGGTVLVVFYPDDEIPVTEVADDGLTVTVP